MTLYIYETETGTLLDTLEAEGYDGDSVSGRFGRVVVGGPIEFSSRDDLSETLRADWKRDHPTLDELMAILVEGGETA